MSRSRLLLVIAITITFVIAADAFREGRTTSVNSPSAAGSLTAATQMLEPRSGHATLLPDGKVLIAGGMRRDQDFYKPAELYEPATGKFQRAGEKTIARG